MNSLNFAQRGNLEHEQDNWLDDSKRALYRVWSTYGPLSGLNIGLNHIRVHKLATMHAVSYPKVFPSFVLGRIENALLKKFTAMLGFMLL